MVSQSLNTIKRERESEINGRQGAGEGAPHHHAKSNDDTATKQAHQ
jgi:hypothetical protein